MKPLYFEVKRSNVKVMIRPNMVKMQGHMHRSFAVEFYLVKVPYITVNYLSNSYAVHWLLSTAVLKQSMKTILK